jgi:hypothetical protein
MNVTPPLNAGADVVGTGTGWMARGSLHVIPPLAVRSPIFFYRVITLVTLRVLDDGVNEVLKRVRYVLELLAVSCQRVRGLIKSICVPFSGTS